MTLWRAEFADAIRERHGDLSDIAAGGWDPSYKELSPLATLAKAEDDRYHSLAWQPKSVGSSTHPQLLAVADHSAKVVDPDGGGETCIASLQMNLPRQLTCGRWDPHAPKSFACAYEGTVALWDTRSHVTLESPHTAFSVDSSPQSAPSR